MSGRLEKFDSAGFKLNSGKAARPQRPFCPKCGSSNTQFLRRDDQWVCRSTKGSRVPLGAKKPQCGHTFAAQEVAAVEVETAEPNPLTDVIGRAFALHAERITRARSEEVATTRGQQAALGYVGWDSHQCINLGRRFIQRILSETKQLITDLDTAFDAAKGSPSLTQLEETRERFGNLVEYVGTLPQKAAEEYVGEQEARSSFVGPRISMLWPAARMELEQQFSVMVMKHSRETSKVSAGKLRGLNMQVKPVHFEDFSGYDFERLIFAFCVQRGWEDVQWIGQCGKDGGRDVFAIDDCNRRTLLLCANYRRFNLQKAVSDLKKVAAGKFPKPHRIIAVCGGAVSSQLRKMLDRTALDLGFRSYRIWSGVELEEWIRKDAPALLRRFCGGEPFPEAAEDLRIWAGEKSPTTNATRPLHLSPNALSLLTAMNAAQDGAVLRCESHDGYSLTIAGMAFVSDTPSPREKAKWDAAINQLQQAGFLTGAGEIFSLTEDAYLFLEKK